MARRGLNTRNTRSTFTTENAPELKQKWPNKRPVLQAVAESWRRKVAVKLQEQTVVLVETIKRIQGIVLWI